MATEETMEMFDKVFMLYNDLQHEKKFRESNKPEMNLIYHLILKNMRSLKTMQVIMDCKDIKNSYLETLPLLRIQLETFLHLVYITEHNNIDVCLSEYQLLQDFQLRRVARNLKNLERKKPNILNDNEKEFMNSHRNNKVDREDIRHLDEIWRLSEKTDKYEDYVRIYSVLSSYIHYNPSTRMVYGNPNGNNVIYNQLTHDEKLENIIINHAIKIGLSTLQAVSNFLDITEIQGKTAEVSKRTKDASPEN